MPIGNPLSRRIVRINLHVFPRQITAPGGCRALTCGEVGVYGDVVHAHALRDEAGVKLFGFAVVDGNALELDAGAVGV